MAHRIAPRCFQIMLLCLLIISRNLSASDTTLEYISCSIFIPAHSQMQRTNLIFFNLMIGLVSALDVRAQGGEGDIPVVNPTPQGGDTTTPTITQPSPPTSTFPGPVTNPNPPTGGYPPLDGTTPPTGGGYPPLDGTTPTGGGAPGGGGGGGGDTGAGGDGGSGQWCIAKANASPTSLQVALDYACGYGGADCGQIQQGASCYEPNTIRDHASFAFNSYYQKHPGSDSCNFGGAAQLTSADPSKTLPFIYRLNYKIQMKVEIICYPNTSIHIPCFFLCCLHVLSYLRPLPDYNLS